MSTLHILPGKYRRRPAPILAPLPPLIPARPAKPPREFETHSQLVLPAATPGPQRLAGLNLRSPVWLPAAWDLGSPQAERTR